MTTQPQIIILFFSPETNTWGYYKVDTDEIVMQAIKEL